MTTGYSALRKHLASKHAAAYDKAIVEKNWNYRLSSDIMSGKSNAVEAHAHTLPPFTQASFVGYIVRFVVADDQVSNAFSVTNLLSSSLSSQFVLSSVLNFATSACSSAQAFKTKISPIETESGRPS